MKREVPKVLRMMGAIAEHMASKCDNLLNKVENATDVQEDLNAHLKACHKEGWLSKEQLDTITYDHVDYLKLLGFRAWDEEDEGGNVLILFPSWLCHWLPKDEPFWSISGTKEPIGDNTDRRLGCLAYGFGFNTKGGEYTPPEVDTCQDGVTCYPPKGARP